MNMTDSRLKNDLTAIESWSKLFAAVFGVLYLLGFLVVASHLSRYGVSSFSVLQLQYLIAGIWVLGPPVVYFLISYASAQFEVEARPDIPVKFKWGRFVISPFLAGIPPAIFILLLALIPKLLESLTWRLGIRLMLFYIAISFCLTAVRMSWQADSEQETWLIRRGAVPFYLALLFVLVLGYALWFSARIYPLIPFSLGGGKPLTVVFIEGERKMPVEIQKTDAASKRSIPYKLLLSTDKYYVVVAPSPKERSIEVSRDAVAGIVVLE